MARLRIWTTGLAAGALACAAITAGATAPAGATKPGSGSATGTARIFMVNPVQSSGDQSLADAKDSATSVPQSQYVDVPLTHLDGSGYLRGDYAVVESSTGTPAFSTTNTFLYDRHDDQFEQTMAYFWVTQAQTYLHQLGFGESLPGVVDQPFPVKIDQYGGDNSYQTDKPYRIRLGKGGVDDAEDAEVIVHEYGHAVQASQIPGFGGKGNLDAGSIGEAFGDYLGVSVGLDTAGQYGWPVRTDPACVADWDSTSYTDAPHCLRTLHEDLTVADRIGEVHFDGQIWSQALWEARLGYQSLGLTARDWDTTLIDSQFGYAPDTSFSAAAATTYATALRRNGQAAADVVRAAFAARGITF
ncbi:Fungalysin metallopeptidase (M36) [Nocardioides terrae]|uniref:Fungalysin metallopeptidase (M36) n=1 Tax=Nocardioides terrae TaxID=574651 RepID=A0A1I1M3J6_9ACTN|nr:M36 family metallopeptidase [Nocardioides terrae]SFC77173.1 Fungalysin metallopeptidase (M36) [Nocardioides terrae]